jgi:crotonobetainyl-CoA:carnitine CoA-transferase CaiB-like acyl-CoA transferase
VAANTPAQFRRLAAVLGVEALCSDARALDLDAFNSPGGFVVPRDTPYVTAQLRSAFESRSAAELEALLNSAGIPAARVRSLGEFLREVDDTGCVDLPDFRFDQGTHTVRTRGLGFAFAQEGEPTRGGAETLGQSTGLFLKDVGVAEDDMARLREANVIRTAAPRPRQASTLLDS